MLMTPDEIARIPLTYSKVYRKAQILHPPHLGILIQGLLCEQIDDAVLCVIEAGQIFNEQPALEMQSYSHFEVMADSTILFLPLEGLMKVRSEVFDIWYRISLALLRKVLNVQSRILMMSKSMPDRVVENTFRYRHFNLTQAQLARIACVSRESVSRKSV